MSKIFFRICKLGLALLLAAVAAPAFAKFYSYSTLQNATDSNGDPVWAKVTFDVSADSMVVTLINLQPNITSVGQNISSLWFTVNSGSSILSLSSASVTLSGNLVSIDQSGEATPAGTLDNVPLGTTGTTIEHWSAGQGSTQFYFNDLNGGSQGGTVDQTIIGPPNSSGIYSSVNSSIYGGNGNSATHNPFIQNQATFTVNAPGLLAGANVSNVQIGFGTTTGNNLRTVPEPGSLALFAIGALAFAFRSKSEGRNFA